MTPLITSDRKKFLQDLHESRITEYIDDSIKNINQKIEIVYLCNGKGVRTVWELTQLDINSLNLDDSDILNISDTLVYVLKQGGFKVTENEDLAKIDVEF